MAVIYSLLGCRVTAGVTLTSQKPPSCMELPQKRALQQMGCLSRTPQLWSEGVRL
jgi:hypothetical protein